LNGVGKRRSGRSEWCKNGVDWASIEGDRWGWRKCREKRGKKIKNTDAVLDVAVARVAVAGWQWFERRWKEEIGAVQMSPKWSHMDEY
jgi:hypothetical protein